MFSHVLTLLVFRLVSAYGRQTYLQQLSGYYLTPLHLHCTCHISVLWSWAYFRQAPIIHALQIPLELRARYHPVLACYGLFWGSALQYLLPILQSEADPSACPFLCPVRISSSSTTVKTHAEYLFRFSATALSLGTPSIPWPSTGPQCPLQASWSHCFWISIHNYLQIAAVTALGEITLLQTFISFTLQTVALGLSGSELFFYHKQMVSLERVIKGH